MMLARNLWAEREIRRVETVDRQRRAVKSLQGSRGPCSVSRDGTF